MGHPSIPGFKSSSGATAAGNGQPSKLTSTLAAYKPSTLLVVDAIFLGLCIIAAIYRDDLKALFGRATGSQGASAAAAASGKR